MNPNPELGAAEAAVIAEIDALEGELIDLASKLVSTRSVNPNYASADYEAEIGGEGSCADVVEAALQGCELKFDRVVKESGRDNLVAVLEGGGEGRSLILNGHMDTVTAGNLDSWQRDPWSGEHAEGSVWGLGAADMKGPIAAGAIALKALSRHPESLGGKVLLQCVIGEETSEGEKGAGAVVEAGYRADAAICMEPTGDRVDGRPELMLAPAASGTLVMRFVVRGASVHAARRREVIHPVSDKRPGISAWEKGLLITEALARLEQNWAFSKISPHYPPGQFILNPGVIHSYPRGAESAFFVPDEFAAEYVIFYSPHDTREQAMGEVLGCIDAAVAQDEWLAEKDWQWDVIADGADGAPPHIEPVCEPRAAFIADAEWEQSPIRLLRERYGLFDFVRALVPAPLSQGAQLLALELSGLDRTWRPSPELVEALAAVAPHVHDGFYRAFLARQELRAHLLDLVTPTQRVIARLLAEGLSETEIGAEVGRSKHTIHDHIKNIYRAWGVRTRVELREVWAGRMSPSIPPPRIERKPRPGAPAGAAAASLRQQINGALRPDDDGADTVPIARNGDNVPIDREIRGAG